MSHRKKSSSKKKYILISLLIILAILVAGIIYVIQSQSANQARPGVKVGDTFFYSITGTSNLVGIDAVIPAQFSQYNQTDFYKVTVTAVSNTEVTLSTEWRFLNGTSINRDQTIDLSSGTLSDPEGFWAVYAPNLATNSLLRPALNDGVIVNSTVTVQYADSTRKTNCWSINQELVNTNDPTYRTLLIEVLNVNFDRQTGMLVNLVDMQQYNNPEMTTAISWKLVSSTVWSVQ
jgi:hypothetical protein